jgi:excisionase family DNA binding protein
MKEIPKDLITQSEAAKLRGVSTAAISDLIKRGRLHPVEIAGKRLLRRSEVKSFKPEKGGRPKKRAKTKKATNK